MPVKLVGLTNRALLGNRWPTYSVLLHEGFDVKPDTLSRCRTISRNSLKYISEITHFIPVINDGVFMRDKDKSNNCIENLELLDQSSHLSMHMVSEERKANARSMANKYRHLTKEWHASKEGHEWHKQHGVVAWENRSVLKRSCAYCGKEFETKQRHQEFCSNACKSANRRKLKADYIEVNCEYCGKSFIKNKYARSTCCSRSCGRTLSWAKSKKY